MRKVSATLKDSTDERPYSERNVDLCYKNKAAANRMSYFSDSQIRSLLQDILVLFVAVLHVRFY